MNQKKMSDEHEKTHENVLNSDKPDNKLEFFWLTFKDSIRNYINPTEVMELEEVSKKLNDLQNEERYDEIEEYIKSHIEKIGYSMILNEDVYRLGHLETNLKRWNRLTGCDIYPMNNTFYCLLLVFLNLSKSKNSSKPEVLEMKKCIKNFSEDTRRYDQLILLMNLSIQHKSYGNIDKLRNIWTSDRSLNLKRRKS